MIQQKNRPPFGSKTKRFYPIGYHPVFETRPGTFKYPNVSPGCYDSKIHRKIISKVPRWKRQQEIEEFCRRLGYKGDHKLKDLQWIKSINGPGWQETPSDPLKSGIAFSKSSRFPVKKFKDFDVPGPVVRFPNMPMNNLMPLSSYKNPLSLSHPNNHFKGKFYRCGKNSVITSRLILKDRGLTPKKDFDVGPGTYDPYPPRVFKQANAPFNSTVIEARPAPKCGLSPPPGRYNPVYNRKILGDGMRSVFISKTKRDFIKVQSESWF